MSARQPEDRRGGRGPTTTGLRAVADVSTLIGREFGGRYRVEAMIGKGGMSVVYRAHDRETGGPVALKIMNQSVADDERQTLRFKQEARASSRLSHPSIVRVVDYGQAPDGLLYMAMELLEGRTLGQVVKQDGPLAPARACLIMADACRALAEAHKLGIIHRDLKPDNVFVLGDQKGVAPKGRDHVKLLDFGIAKVVGEGNYETLTQTGFICGTPLYISPEQSLGQELDGRSDLYSAGVILFELLTGKTPFMAETPIALVMKHIHNEPPALEATNPAVTVPEGLRSVVYRLLSKDRNKRSRSAQEVAETLERLAPTASAESPAPPPGWEASGGALPVAVAVAAESSDVPGTAPHEAVIVGNPLPDAPVIKPSRTASRVALRPIPQPQPEAEGHDATRMLAVRAIDTSPDSQPLPRPRRGQVVREGRGFLWGSVAFAVVLVAGLAWLFVSLNATDSAGARPGDGARANTDVTVAPNSSPPASVVAPMVAGSTHAAPLPAGGAARVPEAGPTAPPPAAFEAQRLSGHDGSPKPTDGTLPPEAGAVTTPLVAPGAIGPRPAESTGARALAAPPEPQGVAVAVLAAPTRESELGERQVRRGAAAVSPPKKRPKVNKVRWKE